MPMENAERTGVRAVREYPTEWTWYPADEEDAEQQEQREEDRNILATANPNSPCRS